MAITAESSQAEVESWLLEIAFKALAPPTKLTVSQWADAKRVLSNKASREPGPWRTSRTPYLRAIMDALSADSPYELIVLQKGSQVGGTEVGLNWMCYVADHAPRPMMIIWPTEQTAKDNVRVRIRPMFQVMPSLAAKIGEAEGPKDTANNLQMMEFPGGYWNFAPSNSTAALKSKPICYALADEVDEYPMDANQQGDPLTLIEARTRTYKGRRKIFALSSPTRRNGSRIEIEFLKTDQRRYYVPCPFCGRYQKLVIEQLRYEAEAPQQAKYQCNKCGELIENFHKSQMLPKGEWRPEAVSQNPRWIGFHLSALYAPVGMYSWGDVASEWEQAKKDPNKLPTFYNTILGETYELRGERPAWAKLYDRREAYEIGTVPNGVLFLTAGVDVQKNRIECEVVGWGRGKESWSINYFVFDGDTSDLESEAWHGLRSVISKGFIHPTGAVMQISCTGIDSGYNTQVVYDFAKPFPLYPVPKVAVMKGHHSERSMILLPGKFPSANVNGKKIKRAIKVTPVGVSVLKGELYGFLGFEKPEPGQAYRPGFCHFPEGYSVEYFKQLTAEELKEIKSKRSGRVTYEWVKVTERNEALDCRIYARAAASIMNIDNLSDDDWDRVEKMVGTIREPKSQNRREGGPMERPEKRRYRSRGI